jgi:peptidoglycan/LPS O-acetylase OafA/YrhL
VRAKRAHSDLSPTGRAEERCLLQSRRNTSSRGLPHRSGDFLGTTAFLLFLIGASAGLPDFGLVALLALTILGAATAATYLARILASRPLVWLGEISYSIYMIHFPVLLVTRRFWERVGFLQWSASGKALAFAVTVAMVIALAALLFYVVERPARMRLRDQMGRLAPA